MRRSGGTDNPEKLKKRWWRFTKLLLLRRGCKKAEQAKWLPALRALGLIQSTSSKSGNKVGRNALECLARLRISNR